MASVLVPLGQKPCPQPRALAQVWDPAVTLVSTMPSFWPKCHHSFAPCRIKGIKQCLPYLPHPGFCAESHLCPPREAHHPGAHGAASGAGHRRAQSTGPTGGTAPPGSQPGSWGSPGGCRAGSRRPGQSRCGPRWLGCERNQRFPFLGPLGKDLPMDGICGEILESQV